MNAALSDPGAVADLTASLAEGAAAHVAEVAKRVPGARLVVQLDEPGLPAVARGEIPTASGMSRLAAVDEEPLRAGLAQVVAAIGAYTTVHCCASSVPFGIIRTAGADAVSFDLSLLRRGEEQGIGEASEAGMGLLVGAIPTTLEEAEGTPRQTAERVMRLYQRLGLPLATCAAQAVITPACGLAGASPAQARGALTRCREAASMLPELIAETGGE